MPITRGSRVEFHNGHDVLRGTVVGRYVDDKRPDMEETWTVFADTVLARRPMLDEHGKPRRAPGKPLVRTTEEGDEVPVLDVDGKQKIGDGGPVTIDTWVKLVNEDGVQSSAYESANGGKLQLVKDGVPIPFRVRARRMTAV
jgi:hypothetical protein